MLPSKKSNADINVDELQSRLKYTNAPYRIPLERPHSPPKSSNDNICNKIMINPPYQLTLSLEELLAPAKRKDSETPPRPQNVFILFRKDLLAKIKNESPKFAKTLRSPEHSKTAKIIWESQPNEVKQFFQVLYLACIEKHKKMYPKYHYIPKPRVKKDRQFTVIESSREVSNESRKESTDSDDSLMSEFFDLEEGFNTFSIGESGC
ncbi:9261_t:CDS:2 [Funneliformis caledonium]|uniref:9261_t:CDS:1 n=1 Tax=Funneliformis caledonium TaxID=1117310 RepID=A0A9N8V1D5_9GLOM|nr:9261_t:CDS:2 [Funneliformis caledonium]